MSVCSASGIPKVQSVIVLGSPSLVTVYTCFRTPRCQCASVLGPPIVHVSLFSGAKVSVCHCSEAHKCYPNSGTPKSIVLLLRNPQVSVCAYSGIPKCQCAHLLRTPSVSVSILWDPQSLKCYCSGFPKCSLKCFRTPSCQCAIFLRTPSVVSGTSSILSKKAPRIRRFCH